MAVVTPDSELQPFLPQVLLTKLRRVRATPTMRTVRECEACHDPVEFWHGTAGWPDHRVICHWAARLRSRAHSAVPGTWILLVMDCATAHVDRRTLSRLKFLGILVILVPARMTWLLQVCDVSCFAPVKAALRYGFLSARVRSVDSQLSQGEWLRTIGEVISRTVSSTDWSHAFTKCGYMRHLDALHGPLVNLLDGVTIVPKLPSLAEFAQLLGRPVHSELTRSLHAVVVEPQLSLSAFPSTSCPRGGARVPVAPRGPAVPLLSSQEQTPGGPFASVVQNNVRRRLGVPVARPEVLPSARSWIVPARVLPEL